MTGPRGGWGDCSGGCLHGGQAGGGGGVVWPSVSIQTFDAETQDQQTTTLATIKTGLFAMAAIPCGTAKGPSVPVQRPQSGFVTTAVKSHLPNDGPHPVKHHEDTA